MSCPRCGGELPPGDREKFGGLCLDCAFAFASEDDPPEIPNLEILSTIGRGGMGVVYKGVQTHLGRTVAVKVVAPTYAATAGFSERMLREAKTLAQLSHPHIVAVHDAGVQDQSPYLVMEFVEGSSLRRVMGGSRLPPDRAARIAEQMCDALQYAHARGVIHRDIKPENVLVAQDGTIKVADFGLARTNDDNPRLTKSNVVLGTPRYMAPEQQESPSRADARTDLYALGVVYYEMLTGTLPVGRFKAPSELAPVGKDVDNLLFKLLETDPEKRFASAAEVRERLAAAPRRGPGSLLVALVAAGLIAAAIAMLIPPSRKSWTELGGSATGGGISRNAGPSAWSSLAVDASGRITVAWDDGTAGEPEIYLRRWEGGEWRELGGSATAGGVSRSPGRSQEPRVAVGVDGRPLVVWREEIDGRFQIYLRRWTGTSWEELGGSASGGGISRSPGMGWAGDLAVDHDGHPLVVWHDSTPGRWQVYLRRWDGAAWADLGNSARGAGVSQSGGTSYYPAIALDREDRPVVAWHEVAGPRHAVGVRRWDGSRWVDLGFPSGWVGEIGGLKVKTDSRGEPIVAWVETALRRVLVRRWDGAAWKDVGSGDVARTGSVNVFVALERTPSGHPMVAWLNGKDVFLRRWDGTSWTGLGDSDAGGGVSRSGAADSPSLAVDADGNPIVAWHDHSPGAPEVYLRRWAAVR